MYNSSAVSNPILAATTGRSPKQPASQTQPERDEQQSFQNTLDSLRDKRAASSSAEKKSVVKKEPAAAKDSLKSEPVKKESLKASPAKKNLVPAGGGQPNQQADDEKTTASANDADSTQTSSAAPDEQGQKKAPDKDKVISGDDADALLALSSPLANQQNIQQAPGQLGLIPQAVPADEDPQPESTEAGVTLLADKVLSGSVLKSTKSTPNLLEGDAAASPAKGEQSTDKDAATQSSLSGSLVSVLAGTENQAKLPLDDVGDLDADPALAAVKTPSAQPLTNNSASAVGLSQAPENDVVDGQLDLTNHLVTDAVKDKVTQKSVSDGASASTTITQDPLAKDPKTIFEKMLQTVAGSNASNNAPDTANLAQPQSSNELSNTLGLDTRAITNSLASADPQTPAARSFVVQTSVPVSVGHPQWSQAVGDKVLWLAAQNVSSAEIRLDPPDLGTMQVKVSVNQDQASISFTSHHPQVREVLDQNMNRLRDMLTEQGMHLVNVDVSDKSFARQQGEGKGQHERATQGDIPAEEEVPVAMSAIVQKRLVDHYA